MEGLPRTHSGCLPSDGILAEAGNVRARVAVPASRFLDISLGSLNELSYALRLARDLKMGSAQESENLDKLRENASRLTWLFYAAILRKVKAARVPYQ